MADYVTIGATVGQDKSGLGEEEGEERKAELINLTTFVLMIQLLLRFCDRMFSVASKTGISDTSVDGTLFGPTIRVGNEMPEPVLIQPEQKMRDVT
jgi:hypothetical protein